MTANLILLIVLLLLFYSRFYIGLVGRGGYRGQKLAAAADVGIIVVLSSIIRSHRLHADDDGSRAGMALQDAGIRRISFFEL